VEMAKLLIESGRWDDALLVLDDVRGSDNAQVQQATPQSIFAIFVVIWRWCLLYP